MISLNHGWIFRTRFFASQQTAALNQQLEQHRQALRTAQLAQAAAVRQAANPPIENPWKEPSD